MRAPASSINAIMRVVAKTAGKLSRGSSLNFSALAQSDSRTTRLLSRSRRSPVRSPRRHGLVRWRARSFVFPAVAVAVAVSRQRRFGNKIDIFGRAFQFHIHQRLLMVLFGDEHVERRHDEQCEDGSDRHSTNEHETD